MYISIEDIEKYKEEVRDYFAPLHREVINAFVYGLVAKLSPANVEEVRPGKWIDISVAPDKIYWKCSACGKETDLPNYEKVCFCFNCGAKMIKE